jgi:hypothetical protein
MNAHAGVQDWTGLECNIPAIHGLDESMDGNSCPLGFEKIEGPKQSRRTSIPGRESKMQIECQLWKDSKNGFFDEISSKNNCQVSIALPYLSRNLIRIQRRSFYDTSWALTKHT